MNVTQDELDARLVKCTLPAPIIWVGRECLIDHWIGWGDPYPEFYRGAQVMYDDTLGDQFRVEETAQIPRQW